MATSPTTPAMAPTEAPAIAPEESFCSFVLTATALQAVAEGAQKLLVDVEELVALLVCVAFTLNDVAAVVPAEVFVIESERFNVQCWPGLSPPVMFTRMDF